jgi:hypothetical protein
MSGTIRDHRPPAPLYAPSDPAAHLESAVWGIEAGAAYITDVTLPYLEAEAIARFGEQTGVGPQVEADKQLDPTGWIMKWSEKAQFDAIFTDGLSLIAHAAIRLLATSTRLRKALEEGDRQMIAALSMLLACEAFMGGYSLDAELRRSTLDEEKRKETSRIARSIGKNHSDFSRARRVCIKAAAGEWQKDPTLLIGKLALKLHGQLLNALVTLPWSFPTLTVHSFPDRHTIRRWLVNAGKDGNLEIPQLARRPGRPRGK